MLTVAFIDFCFTVLITLDVCVMTLMATPLWLAVGPPTYKEDYL